MRHFFLVFPILALALGGCVTSGTSTTTGGVPTNPKIDSVVTQVQQTAAKICGFLPTVKTVTQIFSADPTIGSIEAIAQQICNAVSPQQTVAGRRVGGANSGTVHGVRVRGRFVGNRA